MARAPAGRDVVDPQQPPQHGLARNCVGREIRIAEDEVVAMAHGPQCVKDVRVENWIDRFQHTASPLNATELFWARDRLVPPMSRLFRCPL